MKRIISTSAQLVEPRASNRYKLAISLVWLEIWQCVSVSFVKTLILPVYMIKTKVAFVGGQLLSSQSKQFKKYSKSSDWLKKSRLSKIATFVLIM